jgi:LuxR family maltose regulon positive regulatory protein
MEKDIKFISTKLKMPAPRRNYIKREKLISKLENILDYKAIFIKGRAASGKTTLVTSFIKEKAFQNVKWVSLDKGNDDLFSFWYYVLEAIKDSLENSEEIFAVSKIMLSKDDVEKLVTMLINLTKTEEEIIIIFDDFHNITDAYLLETIEYFIKYSGDNVHFVLLSREESLIYFGDLAMSDRLLEINEEEMKFSKQEGIAFIKNTLKANFEDEFINEINKVSEGWVGGLQLITLAGNKKNISRVNVVNKYMVDYLSKEILDDLLENERDFLIKTSVLSYFNENICNKLLNISNSKEIIDGLLEKNLFLISIDEDNGIYRYHNIFSEFLNLEFMKNDKETIKSVHLMAGEIFEELCDLEESLNHFLAVEQYGKGMKIIEGFGQNQKGWPFLNKIPMEFILENRSLTLQKFFHHFCNVELEPCKEVFAAACLRKEYEDMKKYFKCLMTLAEGNYEDFDISMFDISTFEEIDKLDISNVSKAILYLTIATFLPISDDYEEINEITEKNINIGENYKNPYIKYYALNQKAQIKEELGELVEAEKIYKELFKMHEEYPMLQKIKGTSYIGIMGIYLINFQLDKFQQYLKKAKEAICSDYLGFEKACTSNLIAYKILTKDYKEIKKMLDGVWVFKKYKEFVYYASIMNVLILSKNVTKEELQSFVMRCEEEEKLFLADKITYVRALIGLEEKEKGLNVINEVLEVSRKYCVKPKLIEAILLKIQILEGDSKSNSREISNLLKEAIYYSYENKIIAPYMLQGEYLKNLLVLLKNEKGNSLNRHQRDFINEVLTYMGKPSKEEILSEREKEILAVLATGASNKEIGETLCISVATVKTHIINIYSKLGVSNRVEATEKFREENKSSNMA